MSSPFFSVLLVSHEKPVLVHQAVRSVREQVFEDWELVVVDSGEMMDELLPYAQMDGRITVAESHETKELREEVHIVSRLYNEMVPRSRGRFITYICDDDLLLPGYLEEFYKAAQGGGDCFYSGLKRVRCDMWGDDKEIIGGMEANEVRGRQARGGKLDCVVDALQFCHSRRAWERLVESHGAAVWPEEHATKGHADGVFMERFGDQFPVQPVAGVQAVNRRSPLSAFCGA